MANMLRENDIRCSKVKKKCESLYFLCQKSEEEVYVSILSLYMKNTASSGKCFISFSNYFPETKGSCNDRFSSKLLKKVKTIISGFFENDTRITESLWLTKDRFMNYLKEVAEFDHF
jgi:hypothetical protein